MSVRYTRRALRQIAEILDYVEAQSPQGVESVRRRLQAVVQLLADQPNAGRATNKGDIRRVVVKALSLRDFLPAGNSRDCYSRR